jgi:type I restriction enzyme R subunit
MIMRPYQVYAASALIDRARFTNKNAYIWHTTGSGKTLTSFKTAQILSNEPSIKKVVFLVDRKDLDSQTTEEFNKFEKDSVDVTDRTDVLVKQMKDKNVHLIVTTIQKMANAVKGSRYAKVMDAYRNEKVVFIIDECHRSQFGDMHRDIVRHFNKAQFFGFTGTPRFEVNGKVEGHIVQTTASLFGDCLHTYLIKDAIFDNNVLGFHVEYIKTIQGDYDLNDQAQVEGIDTDELLFADARMTMIANHIIANHKAKTRNRQYTAIFAVWSIPALIKYYDIFKRIDHDLNIAAIFSYGANEDGEGKEEHSRDALERIIGDYNKTYDTNYSTDIFTAYHKDISDRVKGKKTNQLDILLVVNMFLTGFDSKPLDRVQIS